MMSGPKYELLYVSWVVWVFVSIIVLCTFQLLQMNCCWKLAQIAFELMKKFTMTQRSFVTTWNMILCPPLYTVCVYETWSKLENSKSNDASAHAHKIRLKYILHIKFDCLNVDELLSVCFHMNEQNGNSILWSRQMLNDHHQIDPTHTLTKPRMSAISVRQKNSPKWLRNFDVTEDILYLLNRTKFSTNCIGVCCTYHMLLNFVFIQQYFKWIPLIYECVGEKFCTTFGLFEVALREWKRFK